MKYKKCSRPFPNQENLEEHVKEKHLIMNVFKCTSCQYISKNREKYTMHVDTKHSNIASEAIGSIAVCPFCNRQSDDRTKLKEHIESVHCNIIMKVSA